MYYRWSSNLQSMGNPPVIKTHFHWSKLHRCRDLLLDHWFEHQCRIIYVIIDFDISAGSYMLSLLLTLVQNVIGYHCFWHWCRILFVIINISINVFYRPITNHLELIHCKVSPINMGVCFSVIGLVQFSSVQFILLLWRSAWFSFVVLW